jgi:hypothetical protein
VLNDLEVDDRSALSIGHLEGVHQSISLMIPAAVDPSDN